MNLRLIARVAIRHKPTVAVSFHTLSSLNNTPHGDEYEEVEEIPPRRRKPTGRPEDEKYTDPEANQARQPHTVPSTDLNSTNTASSASSGDTPRKPVAPDMTPRKLMKRLNDFIVGQDRSKKIFAVAIYNHYLRTGLAYEEDQRALAKKLKQDKIDEKYEDTDPVYINVSRTDYDAEEEIPVIPDKANLMVMGPTGSGKTLMAKTLATFLSLPISISDCTAMTQAGYVGDDVQSCVQNLYQMSGCDVKRTEHGIIVLDEIDKLAKDKVYRGRDVAGEGVQQSLLKMLEGTVVTIEGNPEGGRAQTTAGLPGGGSAMPKEHVSIDTKNILFILMGAFVGLSDIVAARCDTSSGIGFNASIRKTSENEATSKGSHDKLVTLENGETANAMDLVTSEDLKKFGMIPELLGRAPTIVKLNHLTEDDLLKILTEPNNNLVDQFRVKFESFGTSIAFTKPALRIVARTAISEGLGARGLHAVMERICLNANYECPGSSTRFVLVDSTVLKDFSMSNTTRDVSLKYYSRGQKYIYIQDIAEEDSKLADKYEELLAEQPTVSKNSPNGDTTLGVREAARDVF